MVRRKVIGFKKKDAPINIVVEKDLKEEFEDKIKNDPEERNNNSNRKIRELIINYLGAGERYRIHR